VPATLIAFAVVLVIVWALRGTLNLVGASARVHSGLLQVFRVLAAVGEGLVLLGGLALVVRPGLVMSLRAGPQWRLRRAGGALVVVGGVGTIASWRVVPMVAAPPPMLVLEDVAIGAPLLLSPADLLLLGLVLCGRSAERGRQVSACRVESSQSRGWCSRPGKSARSASVPLCGRPQRWHTAHAAEEATMRSLRIVQKRATGRASGLCAAGLALLLLAVLGAGGCTQSTTPNSVTPNSVTLTRADNGRTVTVQSGGKVLLTLEENQTTGYRWAIAQLNETVLGLTNSTYTIFSASPSVVGEGGVHTFAFKAKQAGTSPLVLRECYPWACASSIIASFAVTIQVR
jgi:inhibitor of cysteine peptidase